MIQCSAVALPQHSISWRFISYDGVEVNITSDSSKYRINLEVGNSSRFSELSILNVQFSDRGRYICIAENVLGTDTKEANLKVVGKL